MAIRQLDITFLYYKTAPLQALVHKASKIFIASEVTMGDISLQVLDILLAIWINYGILIIEVVIYFIKYPYGITP